MKRLKYIILSICCLSLIVCSCVEEFNAVLPESDTDLLVVDGNIVSDSTVIFTLSRSFSINEESIPENYNQIKAEVTVIGSDGSNYKGKELGNGKYGVTIGTLNPQNNYHLEIIWEGNTYTSTPQKPLVTEDMTLNFKQSSETGPVHIQITTPPSADGETSYYIWDYVEDWEIRTVFRCCAVFDPKEGENGTIIEYDEPPYDQGWVHKEPYDILINSTDNFQGNHLKEKTLYSIGHNDNRISHLYSTFVTQRKITKGEYEYYQCKERYTNDMGGLFTPQPSELPTNITCINKDKRVIGYVGVNMNVSQQRMFIPTTEVCYEQAYHCMEYGSEHFNGDDNKTIYLRGYQISFYSAPPMMPPIINWAPTNCVDCRALGADPNAKPDFWPDF